MNVRIIKDIQGRYPEKIGNIYDVFLLNEFDHYFHDKHSRFNIFIKDCEIIEEDKNSTQEKETIMKVKKIKDINVFDKIGKVIENKKDNENIYVEIIEEDKNSTQEKIEILCNNFSNFLKEKNKRYGDSALNPENIFPNDDELYIRINDKLSRIKENTKNNKPVRKNDLTDLYGYISLALIKNNWIDFNDLLD